MYSSGLLCKSRPVKFLEKKLVTTRAMTTLSKQGARAALHAREGKQNLGILAYYLLA